MPATGRGCDARGMRRPFLLALPLLALAVPGAAQACSMVANPRPPTPAQLEAAARLLVDRAPVIIDGEVIRPFVPGRSPALVRVHRQFKGPARPEVEIGRMTSSHVGLVRLGG